MQVLYTFVCVNTNSSKSRPKSC